MSKAGERIWILLLNSSILNGLEIQIITKRAQKSGELVKKKKKKNDDLKNKEDFKNFNLFP